MKVKDIIPEINGKVLSCENKIDNEFKGICSSDLLSFVMSRGEKDNGIVTVLNNVNVLAVATLVEASCVIIPSSIEVQDMIIKKANDEDILIISTDLSTYEVCGKIYNLEKN